MSVNRLALDLARLERLYVLGMDINTIAETMGCRTPAVRRNLDRLGLLPMKHLPRTHAWFKKAIAAPAAQPQAIAMPVHVDRDPCTYCGVRGDIGCKHNRRAAA